VLVWKILGIPATSTQFCNAWRTRSRSQPICRAGSTSPHVSAVGTVNEPVRHIMSDDNVTYELVDFRGSSNWTEYYMQLEVKLNQFHVLLSFIGVTPKTKSTSNPSLPRLKRDNVIRFYSTAQFHHFFSLDLVQPTKMQSHIMHGTFSNGWSKFRAASFCSLGWKLKSCLLMTMMDKKPTLQKRLPWSYSLAWTLYVISIVVSTFWDPQSYFWLSDKPRTMNKVLSSYWNVTFLCFL